MKKLLLGLFIVAGFAISAQAQRITFRYYPDQNVYYNTRTHQYAYADNGNWTYARRLPSQYTIQRRSYVTVYGDKDDIWRDNQMHREKYKDWDRRHKENDRRHDGDRDRGDRDNH